MTPQELARLIDHTALKPDTTEARIRTLCEEARRYGFAAVCVNPCFVPLAAELLQGSEVAVCTVVGFPLGANRTAIKAAEAEQAIRDGAAELDMVQNIGLLKSGRLREVLEDIRAVVGVARAARPPAGRDRILVKVILETALLTDAEKETACRLALEAGADFVKTSTGFAGGGATVEDVALMRRVVGDRMGVKASGGIRTRAQAEALVAAGASRLGTSAGVALVQDGASDPESY
ncbi:deoxyribose-phosphate aldolase [Rhodothermus marinus]|uniref:Deoxyribose-phosphate aldolase n=1 Tax=Rhodothermus marinus (strain ATCC 43812 / DSM 4252 / R-10) TaxID=518766 RepID=D0MHJ1_RHOM4|nr:deoxyribose-phosphate aldolase [Rhodothermus marinus]ACY47949.1 deoxyribose-phosphate aldolase [Rhodothermus marinus DSM 4252]